MGNTTHLYAKNAGSYSLAAAIHGKLSGSWLPAKFVYQKISGSWRAIFSVLAGSASNVSNTSASGASTSGTATTGTPSLSASGNAGTLTYSWANTGGDGSFTCSNAAIANPTFSRAFTGVANGTTSSTVTSNWRCTVTDGDTGATTAVDITASAAWTNTIPAFGPISVSFSGGIAASHTVSDGNLFTTVSATSSPIVSGGNGSYIYTWSYVSGDSMSVDSLSIYGPTFSAGISTPLHDTVTKSAVYNLSVTDTIGTSPANANGTVNLTHTRF